MHSVQIGEHNTTFLPKVIVVETESNPIKGMETREGLRKQFFEAYVNA